MFLKIVLFHDNNLFDVFLNTTGLGWCVVGLPPASGIAIDLNSTVASLLEGDIIVAVVGHSFIANEKVRNYIRNSYLTFLKSFSHLFIIKL